MSKYEFRCDKCSKILDYNMNEVYHASGIIDGKPDGHIHLCVKCHKDTFGAFKFISKDK